MKTYYLCDKKGCCPTVEIGGKQVKIGEEGNQVVLKKGEWDTLVKKIRTGEIE